MIARADSLTRADSSSFEVLNAIGQAYEGMLRYREAYGYYRLCLDMDTTNLDILNTLARTATNLGKAKDAERYFQQVLATDSLNFYANYQLARLYSQLGEYVNDLLKNGLDLNRLTFTRPLFESLYADMSDRGATEQTMLSPNNRKSQLSIDELRSLIEQLPEISEGTKELIRMDEREKKSKEKK